VFAAKFQACFSEKKVYPYTQSKVRCNSDDNVCSAHTSFSQSVTTIYEASERDFRIVLAKDATSQAYDKGLEELRNIGVSIMNTQKCIHGIHKGGQDS
jgi:hypothetical protein